MSQQTQKLRLNALIGWAITAVGMLPWLLCSKPWPLNGQILSRSSSCPAVFQSFCGAVTVNDMLSGRDQIHRLPISMPVMARNTGHWWSSA